MIKKDSGIILYLVIYALEREQWLPLTGLGSNL